MDSSKVLPKGRVLNGVYTIEKVLGAGGFGITYLARRMTGNITQWLAIKEYFISSLCSRSGDDVWVSNVNREQFEIGKAAFISQANRIYRNAIHYPYIVSVDEVFEQNDTAYYVMEFVRGCTLAEYVGERGGLSPESAMEFFEPLLQAVHLLHSLRILHLDLKPENVIIGRDNITDELKPVIIDFDLSKHYDQNGDVTSALKFISCSEGYAPKEQYELMGVSHFVPQADVYALGATLLFMLTGQSPCIASAFNREEIDTLLPEGTPEYMRKAIYKAMAPNVADRTPTVAQMAGDLGLDTQGWPTANDAERNRSRDISTKSSFPWGSIGIVACLCVMVFGIVYWMRYDSGELKPQTVVVGDQEIRMMPVVCGADTFYMADKEVSQALWKEVMGATKNKKYERFDEFPVCGVSPKESEAFIERLNDYSGVKFRLPTSEEWMYAYRGGSKMTHRYPGSNKLKDVSWFSERIGNPQKTGGKKPNELGLYDMLGNVAELTNDEKSGSSILRQLRHSVRKDAYNVCGLSWMSQADSVQPCVPYSKLVKESGVSDSHKPTPLEGVGLRLAADYPLQK